MRNLASVISRSLKIGIFSLALLIVATPATASTTFPEPLPFNIQRTHRNWSTEYVEAQATITTPTNQDVLIPGEDVEVSLEHEVQKYVLTLNDEVKEFQLGNHMAVELLVNDEVVAVQDLNWQDWKQSTVEFTIPADKLPEAGEEARIKAKVYSYYINLSRIPESFREFYSQFNRLSVETEEVSVLVGLTVDKIREKAEVYLLETPNEDEDGDGLTNLFETEQLVFTTLPFDPDTDNDGVSDADEDTDEDGLTNIREQELGTQPMLPDMDNDGLTDGEEVDIHGTDPKVADTDGDGLEDGLEVELGFNPLLADTDGNGTPDNQENVTFEEQDEETGVSVTIEGSGEIRNNVQVLPLEVLPEQDDNGVFKSAYDIVNNTEAEFEQATISLPYNEEMLEGTNPEDLVIAFYEPESGTLKPLENQVLDAENQTVSGTTPHFSQYVLIDRVKADEILAQEFFGSIRGNGGAIAITFSIDSSGSMSGNDPQNIRKSVTKDLIDSLDEEDKVGIVDFDSSARVLQGLTTDKESAKQAVDQINSSGGTNIGAAVSVANQMLINEEVNGSKISILLTDGQGSYNQSFTQEAKDNGIIIYTIGLGNGVNENLLRSIAEGTGGQYYQVAQADQLVDVFDDIKG